MASKPTNRKRIIIVAEEPTTNAASNLLRDFVNSVSYDVTPTTKEWHNVVDGNDDENDPDDESGVDKADSADDDSVDESATDDESDADDDEDDL